MSVYIISKEGPISGRTNVAVLCGWAIWISWSLAVQDNTFVWVLVSANQLKLNYVLTILTQATLSRGMLYTSWRNASVYLLLVAVSISLDLASYVLDSAASFDWRRTSCHVDNLETGIRLCLSVSDESHHLAMESFTLGTMARIFTLGAKILLASVTFLA